MLLPRPPTGTARVPTLTQAIIERFVPGFDAQRPTLQHVQPMSATQRRPGQRLVGVRASLALEPYAGPPSLDTYAPYATPSIQTPRPAATYEAMRPQRSSEDSDKSPALPSPSTALSSASRGHASGVDDALGNLLGSTAAAVSSAMSAVGALRSRHASLLAQLPGDDSGGATAMTRRGFSSSLGLHHQPLAIVTDDVDASFSPASRGSAPPASSPVAHQVVAPPPLSGRPHREATARTGAFGAQASLIMADDRKNNDRLASVLSPSARRINRGETATAASNTPSRVPPAASSPADLAAHGLGSPSPLPPTDVVPLPLRAEVRDRRRSTSPGTSARAGPGTSRRPSPRSQSRPSVHVGVGLFARPPMAASPMSVHPNGSPRSATQQQDLPTTPVAANGATAVPTATPEQLRHEQRLLQQQWSRVSSSSGGNGGRLEGDDTRLDIFNFNSDRVHAGPAATTAAWTSPSPTRSEATLDSSASSSRLSAFPALTFGRGIGRSSPRLPSSRGETTTPAPSTGSPRQRSTPGTPVGGPDGSGTGLLDDANDDVKASLEPPPAHYLRALASTTGRAPPPPPPPQSAAGSRQDRADDDARVAVAAGSAEVMVLDLPSPLPQRTLDDQCESAVFNLPPQLLRAWEQLLHAVVEDTAAIEREARAARDAAVDEEAAESTSTLQLHTTAALLPRFEAATAARNEARAAAAAPSWSAAVTAASRAFSDEWAAWGSGRAAVLDRPPFDRGLARLAAARADALRASDALAARLAKARAAAAAAAAERDAAATALRAAQRDAAAATAASSGDAESKSDTADDARAIRAELGKLARARGRALRADECVAAANEIRAAARRAVEQLRHDGDAAAHAVAAAADAAWRAEAEHAAAAQAAELQSARRRVEALRRLIEQRTAFAALRPAVDGMLATATSKSPSTACPPREAARFYARVLAASTFSAELYAALRAAFPELVRLRQASGGDGGDEASESGVSKDAPLAPYLAAVARRPFALVKAAAPLRASSASTATPLPPADAMRASIRAAMRRHQHHEGGLVEVEVAARAAPTATLPSGAAATHGAMDVDAAAPEHSSASDAAATARHTGAAPHATPGSASTSKRGASAEGGADSTMDAAGAVRGRRGDGAAVVAAAASLHGNSAAGARKARRANSTSHAGLSPPPTKPQQRTARATSAVRSSAVSRGVLWGAVLRGPTPTPTVITAPPRARVTEATDPSPAVTDAREAQADIAASGALPPRQQHAPDLTTTPAAEVAPPLRLAPHTASVPDDHGRVHGALMHERRPHASQPPVALSEAQSTAWNEPVTTGPSATITTRQVLRVGLIPPTLESPANAHADAGADADDGASRPSPARTAYGVSASASSAAASAPARANAPERRTRTPPRSAFDIDADDAFIAAVLADATAHLSGGPVGVDFRPPSAHAVAADAVADTSAALQLWEATAAASTSTSISTSGDAPLDADGAALGPVRPIRIRARPSSTRATRPGSGSSSGGGGASKGLMLAPNMSLGAQLQQQRAARQRASGEPSAATLGGAHPRPHHLESVGGGGGGGKSRAGTSQLPSQRDERHNPVGVANTTAAVPAPESPASPSQQPSRRSAIRRASEARSDRPPGDSASGAPMGREDYPPVDGIGTPPRPPSSGTRSVRFAETLDAPHAPASL